MRNDEESERYSALLEGSWENLKGQGFLPWDLGAFQEAGGRGAVRCEACGKTYAFPDNPYCPTCEQRWMRAQNSMKVHAESVAQTDQFLADDAEYNRQSNVIGWMVCALVLLVTVACIVLMSR